MSKIADFFAELGVKVDTKDLKKLENSIGGLNKSLKKLEKPLQAANKTLGSIGKDTSIRKQKFAVKSLIAQAEKLGLETGKYKRQLGGIKKQDSFDKIKLDIKEAILAQKKLNDTTKEQQRQASRSAKQPSQRERIERDLRRIKRTSPAQDILSRSASGEGVETSSRVKEARRQYEQLIRQLDGTEDSFLAVKQAVKKANMALKANDKRAEQSKRKIGSLRGQVDNLNRSFKQMALQATGAFAVAQGAGATFTTGKEFDALDIRMQLIAATAEEADANFKFLRETTERIGVDFLTSSKAFIKMASSVDPAKVSLSEVKELFIAVSETSTAFQLSTEESKRVFNAFTQIASKGKVSLEEVKSQLGESIPAIRIFSEAMGISVEQFLKQAEEGKILSDVVLPKVAKRMREFVAPGIQKAQQSLQSRQTRFMNTLKETSRVLFESGLREGLEDLFTTMKENLVVMEPLFKILGSVFGVIVKAIAFILRVTITPLRVITGLVKEWQEAMEGVGEYASHIKGFLFGSGLIFGFELLRRNSAKIVSNIKVLIPLFQKLGQTAVFRFLMGMRKFAAFFLIFDELIASFQDSKVTILKIYGQMIKNFSTKFKIFLNDIVIWSKLASRDLQKEFSWLTSLLNLMGLGANNLNIKSKSTTPKQEVKIKVDFKASGDTPVDSENARKMTEEMEKRLQEHFNISSLVAG